VVSVAEVDEMQRQLGSVFVSLKSSFFQIFEQSYLVGQTTTREQQSTIESIV
jgi:hypothetical protein